MKKNYLLAFMLLATLFLAAPVSANSAEPPLVWILITRPTHTVDATLTIEGQVVQGYIRQESKVTFIRFFRYEIDQVMDKKHSVAQATLSLTVDNVTTFHQIDIDRLVYNVKYTFDNNHQTLIEGTSIFRETLLISTRIMLTLLVEAAIFFIFGYRKLRTWSIFLLINLITQSSLNIIIGGFNPIPTLIGFYILEISILLFESISMTLAIQEGSKLKILCTVIVANISSLGVGSWLLTTYPF